MARINIPLIDVTMSGASVGSGTGEVQNDGVSGLGFVNDGNVFLHVRNPDTAGHLVGFRCPLLIDGQAVSQYNNSISAGAEELVGPFPPRLFNQSDGSVWIEVDSNLLMFKAYRIPKVG